MNNNPLKQKIVEFVKARRGGCTAGETSVLLGINHWKTRRYFKQLETEGVFEKVTYGRYRIKEY